MLTKVVKKRIVLSTAVLFAISLICLLPQNKIYSLKNIKEEVNYVDDEIYDQVIYLLDKNDMLGRIKIAVGETDIEKKAKFLLETLIIDGKNESKLPSGFKGVIPNDTKINSLSYDKGLIKVDFSKELLNIDKKHEEKIIEAIVYTLTSIDEIERIIIYIDGEILTKLPKTGINLPSTLDKKYGINKKYDILSYKNINQVIIYYINKYNDNYYYVPVTKYMNDKRDKIEIIIEELASFSTYNSNLMSFLNSNTKLLSTELNVDTLSLVFNDYIFNDVNKQKILEEVIYTISLSVKANYDVKEVVFRVQDKEIYKSALKTIEN